MQKNRMRQEGQRLRELARRTLEAYRNLNAAAADAAFVRSGKLNGESISRAGKLLEDVIAEIKGHGNGDG
ncbi:MAG: hypothetical protein GWN32_04760 [Gemmatimonadetes bacterium]|nr:hypothetical protein [Gemmatimonadota bacterium]